MRTSSSRRTRAASSGARLITPTKQFVVPQAFQHVDDFLDETPMPIINHRSLETMAPGSFQVHLGTADANVFAFSRHEP
ncbi:MAG: hypothetical protein ACLP01_14650 [Solirubrobacteraceae bacterium]